MSAPPIGSLNALSADAFAAALDGVVEHSPWILRRAAAKRPFGSLAAAQAALEAELYGADEDSQLTAIRAHPDLAAKLEALEGLTDFSRREQQAAGFAALEPRALERLRTLLAAYRERFGHPFILCLRDHDAAAAAPILEARLKAAPQAERVACLVQIARIAWHRLRQRVQTLERPTARPHRA